MKTLLVIDDDNTILALFQAFLSREGYRVITAEGGAAGLEAFALHHPDAVVCDLRMPGTDGLAVLERIKTDSPLTPFVIMSGNSDIGSAVDALRRGAWDYLIKPFVSLEIIPPALDRLAERAALLAEKERYQARLESEIAIRTAELTDQLHEKDLLLAEVHHRVKNNLQVILILLGLQQESSTNPEAIRVLTESQNRLHLLALIQEELHDPTRASSVGAEQYFRNLVHHALSVSGLTREVDLELELDDVDLAPGQAFTFGLVANEILTALAVHRPESQRVRVVLQFTRNGSAGYRLAVEENGGAFARWTATQGGEFTGYALLTALVKQASGTVSWSVTSPAQLVLLFP